MTTTTDKVCGCKLKDHAQLDLINACILNRDPHRGIARRYSTPEFPITKDLVGRHALRCLGLTATSARAKAVISRRTQRAVKTAEAAVKEVMDSVAAPLVRSQEAVQRYNEELLAAFRRRRIAAEARNDDRLFVVMGREEKDILSLIERNSGRIAAGATFTNNNVTLSMTAIRHLSDSELQAIVAGDLTALPGAA